MLPAGFETLTPQEYELLKDAIAYITILVASADGNIDPREKEWAEKITEIRGYAAKIELQPYYDDIGKDFHDRLERYIADLPEGNTEISAALRSKLVQVNPILAKLDNKMAVNLYRDFLSFAKHVAKATGGFLSFGSISAAEKKVIGLDMIEPVHPIEED
jgi:hypothetical protein